MSDNQPSNHAFSAALRSWLDYLDDRTDGPESIALHSLGDYAQVVKIGYAGRDGVTRTLHLFATMHLGQPVIAAMFEQTSPDWPGTAQAVNAWYTERRAQIGLELQKLASGSN